MAGIIDSIRRQTIDAVAATMEEAGGSIADGMRQKLIANRHVDTGRLVGSIDNLTEVTDKEINEYITIDARNPKNGAWYAEFLEFGTGIYNSRGDGRQTPWKYQDEHGNWHTTRGMAADPFIRPSVAEYIGELEQKLGTAIKQDVHIERYRQEFKV